ncbi:MULTISPECIES: hypothetical protein [Herbidospora]|uniref:hypothetical protein n=1 Tax=Herbidospora TaxID=28443 RepID=UPI000ADF3BAE|nr:MULTISPECIES: hypothetical protein [Herbidospora]
MGYVLNLQGQGSGDAGAGPNSIYSTVSAGGVCLGSTASFSACLTTSTASLVVCM